VPTWSRSRTRSWAIPAAAYARAQPDDDPYYFHVFNANKKSIAVNLKSESGLALVKDMI